MLRLNILSEGQRKTGYDVPRKTEKNYYSLNEALNKKLVLLEQTGLGDTTRFLPRQATTNNVASNINLPKSGCTWLGTTPRTLPRHASVVFMETIKNARNIQDDESLPKDLEPETWNKTLADRPTRNPMKCGVAE